jgi:hypothetical protein
MGPTRGLVHVPTARGVAMWCRSKALDEETRARHFAIGREYNVQYQRRARKEEADLHRKIKLKLEVR